MIEDHRALQAYNAPASGHQHPEVRGPEWPCRLARQVKGSCEPRRIPQLRDTAPDPHRNQLMKRQLAGSAMMLAPAAEVAGPGPGCAAWRPNRQRRKARPGCAAAQA